MKIKPNYLQEAAEAEKREDARRPSKLRQMYNEPADATSKPRQIDSPVKEELKFAGILENSAKIQKPGQQRDDAKQDGGDEKKDKKQSAKDAAENLTGEAKSEKYESSSGGGSFGGQSGFGSNDVNQLNLNENFAARSILHIADLERLVSTIRSQTALGGRREIVLQLKRSVLEGLRVKITTDAAAQVGIEFFAGSESVRSQIEKHSEELAGILRGRGINLQSMTTSLGSGEENQNSSDQKETTQIESLSNTTDEDLLADNTFNQVPAADGKKYHA
ncbi:MAG: flagellar hook-length control protein FliK [Pyrinomonadaceae bacterium]